MGIDVVLYAQGEVTDDQLAEANVYLKDRAEIAWDWRETGWVIGRGTDYDTEKPIIELATGSRYYGPHYERGPWPNIYGAIRLMQTAFPDLPIFYGSDSGGYAQECTEEFLAEMWEHYLGPHGDDYRREMRAWNAAQNAKNTP